MIGVTLDSNVYISALEFHGVGARLLLMARAGAIRIDISGAILTETMGVLRDKFGWQGYRLRFGQEALRKLAKLGLSSPLRRLTLQMMRTTTVSWSARWRRGRISSSPKTKTYCGLEVTGASPSSARRISCIERFEARILIYNRSIV